MLPDDSAHQELHLIKYCHFKPFFNQILGIAKNPNMNIRVLCTILFHQTTLPPLSLFLRKQGKHCIFLKKIYESISEV